MRSAHWLLLLRLAALLALATSAALMADYVAAEPAFCGQGTGCAQVRASGYSHVSLPGLPRLPLPLLGLLGFGAVLGASIIPDAQRRSKLTVPLAVLLAVSGLGLIVLQVFVIGHVCAFCMVVDLCALAIGGAALGLQRGEGWEQSAREELTETFIIDSSQLVAESQRLRGVWREDSRVYTPPNPLIAAQRPIIRLRGWAWAALGLVAVAAPLLWPHLRPTVPVIRQLYQPGKINVVEFADFQCPHCRDLHGRLKELLQEYQDRVHFQRLHVPLPIHPQAQGAARAGICAEAQGHGESMADHLFATEDLSPAANRKAAERLGLDLAQFDACLNDPTTTQRIERDIELLREATFVGLPTTYIGKHRIVGAAQTEVFREALEKAAEEDEQTGVPGWLYFVVCLLIVAAILHWGRTRPPKGPEDLVRPTKNRRSTPPRLNLR